MALEAKKGGWGVGQSVTKKEKLSQKNKTFSDIFVFTFSSMKQAELQNNKDNINQNVPRKSAVQP